MIEDATEDLSPSEVLAVLRDVIDRLKGQIRTRLAESHREQAALVGALAERVAEAEKRHGAMLQRLDGVPETVAQAIRAAIDAERQIAASEHMARVERVQRQIDALEAVAARLRDGEKGDPGEQGPEGPAGVGIDSIEPDVDGLRFVLDDEREFIVQFPPAPKGEDGVGIVALSARDGQLVAHLSDGSEHAVPMPRGARGEPGADGRTPTEAEIVAAMERCEALADLRREVEDLRVERQTALAAFRAGLDAAEGAVAALEARIGVRLAELRDGKPGPQGERGEKGDKGDAPTEDEVQELIDRALEPHLAIVTASLERQNARIRGIKDGAPGEKGEKGDPPSEAELRRLVEEAMRPYSAALHDFHARLERRLGEAQSRGAAPAADPAAVREAVEAAVAPIRLALDAEAEALRAAVAAQLAAVRDGEQGPPGEKGEKGDPPSMDDLRALVAEAAAPLERRVAEAVERAEASVAARLAEVRDGERGPKGEKGDKGDPPLPEMLRALIAKAVEPFAQALERRAEQSVADAADALDEARRQILDRLREVRDGEPGPQGERGEKGDKGDAPTEDELHALIDRALEPHLAIVAASLERQDARIRNLKDGAPGEKGEKGDPPSEAELRRLVEEAMPPYSAALHDFHARLERRLGEAGSRVAAPAADPAAVREAVEAAVAPIRLALDAEAEALRVSVAAQLAAVRDGEQGPPGEKGEKGDPPSMDDLRALVAEAAAPLERRVAEAVERAEASVAARLAEVRDGERGPQGEKGDPPSPDMLRALIAKAVEPFAQALERRAEQSVADAADALDEARRQILDRLREVRDGEPGPQGERGPEGPQGERGPEGPPGRDRFLSDARVWRPGVAVERGEVLAYANALWAARRGADGSPDDDPAAYELLFGASTVRVERVPGQLGLRLTVAQPGEPDRATDLVPWRARGVWQAASAYEAGDLVVYRHRTFMAGRDVEPAEAAPDANKAWAPFIEPQRGPRGDRGETGPQGRGVSGVWFDGRQLLVSYTDETEDVVECAFAPQPQEQLEGIPLRQWRGPYRGGQDYRRGDVVTLDGALFAATRDAPRDPNTPDWTFLISAGAGQAVEPSSSVGGSKALVIAADAAERRALGAGVMDKGTVVYQLDSAEEWIWRLPPTPQLDDSDWWRKGVPILDVNAPHGEPGPPTPPTITGGAGAATVAFGAPPAWTGNTSLVSVEWQIAAAADTGFASPVAAGAVEHAARDLPITVALAAGAYIARQRERNLIGRSAWSPAAPAATVT